MKNTLIALAAVIGLTGSAYAMDNAEKSASTPVQAEVQTKEQIKLIKKSQHGIVVDQDGGFASKAGIDVNPNFLPHF